jgi:hypothetical protein
LWPGQRTRRGWRREELDSLRKQQRLAMAPLEWRIIARKENPWRCVTAKMATPTKVDFKAK